MANKSITSKSICVRISNQYSCNKHFVSTNHGKKHIKFEAQRPLTISEMYYRVTHDLPLSVPRPAMDRIPLNDSFFVDGFDVLDAAISNNMRLNAKAKEQQLLANEQARKEREEFEKWKFEQQKQHVLETSV